MSELMSLFNVWINVNFISQIIYDFTKSLELSHIVLNNHEKLRNHNYKSTQTEQRPIQPLSSSSPSLLVTEH